MYQLYRAADRTSPPAPVIAQAGRTRGLKLIVEAHDPHSSRTQDSTLPWRDRKVGGQSGEIQLDLAHHAQQAPQ